MLILFDFDGTLVDVKKKYFAVYSDFVEFHHGTALPIENYWRMKRRNASIEEILHASNIQNIEPTVFKDYIKNNIEKEKFLRLDMLVPKSLNVLKDISINHTCYLVSMRRNQKMLLAQTEWLGIKPFFTRVFSPQPFIEQEDASPNTVKSRLLGEIDLYLPALIIGDSGMDIKTGKRLAIHTCAVTTGIREKSFLKQYCPDFIINSIGDIYGVLDVLNK